MTQITPSAPPLSSARLTAALVLAMLLASLGTSIANIALPVLGTAFAAPFSGVQRVVVAYLAGLTVAAVYAGRLGDRFGLRPMLAAGLLLFAAASLLCSLASQLPLLVLARLLQGIGAAFMMTLSMALMRQISTAGRPGRSMGLMGSVSALGTALGPALGGLLLPLTGWRGLFWMPLPLAIVALLLLLVALPGQPPATSGVPPGLRQVLNRAMFNTLALNLLVAAVMMTTLVVGPFYLSQGLRLTDGQAGLIMASGPLIGMCCGVPAGRLVDRFGHRYTQRLGLALMAGGTLLLAFTGAAGGVTSYLLAIMILTPGYQLCQVANNSAVLAKVPDNQRGTASGLINLSRNLGLIAGASLLGALFAWATDPAVPATAGAEPVVVGMRLTFLTVGVMLTLTLLSTLRKAAGRQTIPE
ncbi:MFS transporter (plasmid) [Erwinia sp. E602]|uniref:MFS transporter n=1 Tax=Erwinia sp. E602 TaxID=2675378 RepID=UPI001BAA6A52|nr:MFS transporter [Erwinia sp. E602]QUG73512.1 MFS transporter [Erwinia sp. E602]